MPNYYYTKFQKNPCVGRNDWCPFKHLFPKILRRGTFCLIGYNFEPEYGIQELELLEEIMAYEDSKIPLEGWCDCGKLWRTKMQKKKYAVEVLTWLFRALKDLTLNHILIHKYKLKLSEISNNITNNIKESEEVTLQLHTGYRVRCVFSDKQGTILK